jgi:hypothetical protein
LAAALLFSPFQIRLNHLCKFLIVLVLQELKKLRDRLRAAKREKLFAEVDARLAELLRAAGRQPRAGEYVLD